MFNSPFGLNYFRTLNTYEYKLYVYCVDMVLQFCEDIHVTAKFMSLETGDKNSAHNHKKLIGKNESLNQVIELNDEN